MTTTATRPATTTAAVAPISRKAVIAGRVITVLVTAFMLFDAFGKLARPESVVKASAELGIASHLLPVIGIILLVATVLYAVPRTALLGAIALNLYLAGAVTVNLIDENANIPFAIVFGALACAGVALRDARARQILRILVSR